ncbi:hypothetical protein [Paractinoplanes lichenicola]|uniref:Uncharacterized protein n=1 Tax=Paractinoplanes lichenicola TaxID=2802976 RepID=A0ABS1VYQ7_9ACTN|nr:hypothetical protein [Actinoplanes lichenicola]MBL7259619.1 hypothetical protein [Actinoplanes lichenicola]
MSSDEWQSAGRAWSPWRFLLACVGLAVLASALGLIAIWLFYSAVLGRWNLPSVVFAVVYPVTYTVFFTGFSFLAARKRPPVLTFAPDRIELAAARCDGVVVPYDAVTRIRMRAWWPITMLDVFVSASEGARIVPVDRAGRRAPCKRLRGELRFRMPLAGLNEPAIRAGLSHHTFGGGAWRSEDVTVRIASDG